jgi:hypothetical protein
VVAAALSGLPLRHEAGERAGVRWRSEPKGKTVVSFFRFIGRLIKVSVFAFIILSNSDKIAAPAARALDPDQTFGD